MYYYIFEPTDDKRVSALYDQIKIMASELNIAGEFVTLSHAEEPSDLARVALRKEFTTIIAVGGDAMINEIGSALFERETALGIIPTNPSSIFFKLIGVENIKEAIAVLPNRKVETVDTFVINKEYSVLTIVSLSPKKARSGVIISTEIDGNFLVESEGYPLSISNIGFKNERETIKESLGDGYFDIFIPGVVRKNRGLFSFLFKGTEETGSSAGSIFHPKKAFFSSRAGLQARIGEKLIASGNITADIRPGSLRLIVSRQRPAPTFEENEEKVTA